MSQDLPSGQLLKQPWLCQCRETQGHSGQPSLKFTPYGHISHKASATCHQMMYLYSHQLDNPLCDPWVGGDRLLAAIRTSFCSSLRAHAAYPTHLNKSLSLILYLSSFSKYPYHPEQNNMPYKRLNKNLSSPPCTRTHMPQFRVRLWLNVGNTRFGYLQKLTQ